MTPGETGALAQGKLAQARNRLLVKPLESRVIDARRLTLPSPTVRPDPPPDAPSEHSS